MDTYFAPAERAHDDELATEIKTLKGIIPICMTCKEIRDDKGYWNKLEKYITQNCCPVKLSRL